MCCVIPPASPAITFALRILSNKEVLPWSTCPITVTIGGRATQSSSLSSSSSALMASTTSALTYSVWKPNSSATILIVSASRRWLMETMIPILIQVPITCVTGTSIMLARSLAVTNSVSFNTLLSISSCSISSCSRFWMASRLSRRYLAPLLFLFPLLVRRAKVSFTCFCTSSSLISTFTGLRRRGLRSSFGRDGRALVPGVLFTSTRSFLIRLRFFFASVPPSPGLTGAPGLAVPSFGPLLKSPLPDCCPALLPANFSRLSSRSFLRSSFVFFFGRVD